MSPEEFKEWRKALGFTQQEAADALGISRGAVENYERGHRREDRRPVEVPLSVAYSCDYVALQEAAQKNDLSLLTGAVRERVLKLGRLVEKSGLLRQS